MITVESVIVAIYIVVAILIVALLLYAVLVAWILKKFPRAAPVIMGILTMGALWAIVDAICKKNKHKNNGQQQRLEHYPKYSKPAQTEDPQESLKYPDGTPYVIDTPQDLNHALDEAYTEVMDAAREDPVKLNPPCCPIPPPCEEKLGWRARYKGCETTFATDNPNNQCKVNPKGERYFVADLNPLIYERGLISGAKWNPYEHFNARQMFTQFISTEIRKDSDPYAKPIEDLNQTFCAQKARLGRPPEYTMV